MSAGPPACLVACPAGPPAGRLLPLAGAGLHGCGHAGDLLRVAPGPWPLGRQRLGGLADGMFVCDDRALPVSFAVASARLGELARGRLLDGVSERVYHGGVQYLLRVGPAGAVPGASRLVRVQFSGPAYRDGEMAVALRWEATGTASSLFPALDADIRLAAEGGHQTRVTLTGSYRPPLGALGGGLDRLVLHTVATATIAALLTRIATALEGAPAQATEPDTLWRPDLGPEPSPRLGKHTALAPRSRLMTWAGRAAVPPRPAGCPARDCLHEKQWDDKAGPGGHDRGNPCTAVAWRSGVALVACSGTWRVPARYLPGTREVPIRYLGRSCRFLARVACSQSQWHMDGICAIRLRPPTPLTELSPCLRSLPADETSAGQLTRATAQ